MDDGTGARNDGNKSIMDEIERKDVTMQGETLAIPSLSKVRQVEVDTRSREAFELLKLGEAICNLQVDQRKMRLSAEDMRFERDRYKASAAAFQDKLVAALNENARLRDLREVLGTLSQQKEAAVAQHASAEAERNRLAAALHEGEERTRMLRRDNEKLSGELREMRETLSQQKEAALAQHAQIEAECTRLAAALHEGEERTRKLHSDNERLSGELEDVRAQSERMRLAYIDMTQKMIGEVKAKNGQAMAMD